MSGRTWQAERMHLMPLSDIGRMIELIGRLRAEGRQVIGFHVGAPDFAAPDHVREATVSALGGGARQLGYTATRGTLPLRRSVARTLAAESGVRVDPEEGVAITVGCQEAMAAVILATLNPGDEVLISDPGYLFYPRQLAMAGAVPVPVSYARDDGWGWEVDRLRQHLSPRTRAIIVNTPHNPTGTVCSRAELEQIAAFAQEHDLLVISDETYSAVVFDVPHVSIASLPGMADRTIVLGSFSKTYAMPGWRVGYAAGPAAIMSAVERVHELMVISVSPFAQAGAEAALEGPQHDVAHMRREFDRRRRAIAEILDGPDIELGTCQGAFYYFPRFPTTTLSSQELSDWFLRETQVAMISGSHFGSRGEGHLRISFATDYEACVEGALRIRAALPTLPRR